MLKACTSKTKMSVSLETTTTLVSSRQACKTIRVSASSWLNSKTSTASFLEIYKVDSVKSGTRYKRGEPTKRIHIRSWDQKMVKGKDWQSFFNSIENKNDLIDITGSCLRHETGRQKVTGNMVFTQNEKTWKISKNQSVTHIQPYFQVRFGIRHLLSLSQQFPCLQVTVTCSRI